MSLDDWTGAAIGEGVTSAPLYARIGPSTTAAPVTV